MTLSSRATILFPLPQSDAQAHRISRMPASEPTVRVSKAYFRQPGHGTDRQIIELLIHSQSL